LIKQAITICLLLVAFNAQALTTQQKVFEKYYALALKGDASAVTVGKQKLNGYRLSHYLDYALLKGTMSQLPEQEIAVFKRTHPDSPLNDSLENMLTYELGKQQKWSRFLKRYKNNRKRSSI